MFVLKFHFVLHLIINSASHHLPKHINVYSQIHMRFSHGSHLFFLKKVWTGYVPATPENLLDLYLSTLMSIAIFGSLLVTGHKKSGEHQKLFPTFAAHIGIYRPSAANISARHGGLLFTRKVLPFLFLTQLF